MVVHNVVWPLFKDVVRASARTVSSVLPSGAFSFVTAGNESVVLVPDVGQRVSAGPVFATSGVNVTVGGVSASVIGRDSATGGLVVHLPPYESVCPNATACAGPSGYVNIVVENPGWVRVVPSDVVAGGSAAYQALQSLLPADDASLGGSVSCPPYCPGVTVAADAIAGVYYTQQCSTAPTMSSFANSSTNNAFVACTATGNCSVGTGDSCQSCTCP